MRSSRAEPCSRVPSSRLPRRVALYPWEPRRTPPESGTGFGNHDVDPNTFRTQPFSGVRSGNETALLQDVRQQRCVPQRGRRHTEVGIARVGTDEVGVTGVKPLQEGLRRRWALRRSWRRRGGAESGRETMLAIAHGGLAQGSLLDSEVGYRLPMRCRVVGTPRVGFSTSEYGVDYRFGYGLRVLVQGGLNFELGVDAQRSESAIVGEAARSRRIECSAGLGPTTR